MPIVNGHVRVERRAMTPRHRVAYAGGVAAAVLIVVGGWSLTVGTQLKSLFEGVKTGMRSASDTFAKARADAAAVPKPVVPDFSSALKSVVEEANAAPADTTSAPAAEPTPAATETAPAAPADATKEATPAPATLPASTPTPKSKTR